MGGVTVGEWNYVGVMAEGDEHGPILVAERYYADVRIVRTRKRGTVRTREYIRDGRAYCTLREALVGGRA